MRRGMILLAVLALFVLAVPLTASAGGNSHAKANGEVYWTSAGGAELYTEFNAHADAPGRYPDRGVAYMELFGPSGWTRTVDFSRVEVDSDQAWMCGEITAGDSAGSWMTMWVKDVGTPGSDGDLIGAYKGTEVAACNRVTERWTGGGTVTGGNLMVHVPK
jgi:hypothetical protein